MSIYDVDLDKTPANYQPLTPLSFLARSASVYPEHIAIIHGKQRTSLCSILCAGAKAGLSPGEGRHQEGRHGFGDPCQYAGDAGMPLRRADDGGGSQHPEHPP